MGPRLNSRGDLVLFPDEVVVEKESFNGAAT
jgi:hypothetical protein